MVTIGKVKSNSYSFGSVRSDLYTIERFDIVVGSKPYDNLYMNMFCRNSVVQKYVGENRINEALSHGTSKKCKAYYKHDVCPWDTSAIIKVTTKLLTSGNIDFASIASAAAKVAASNLS